MIIKILHLDLYTKPTVSKSKAINELKQYFHACNDMRAINALKSDEFRAEIDVRLLLLLKFNQ
jgi:hypothetical protein